MTITPELKQAIHEAGEKPVPIEDPETKTSYVMVKRDVYERLVKLVEVESVDPSLYEYGEFVSASSMGGGA
jgi:hypothetical protein